MILDAARFHFAMFLAEIDRPRGEPEPPLPPMDLEPRREPAVPFERPVDEDDGEP